MNIFYRWKIKPNKQNGITLIETMIALTITGVIASGVATTLYQLQGISNSHFAHVMAVNQVENAVHYINRDVQCSQTVEPNSQAGSHGFPLNLTWNSWDTNDINKVTYNLESDAPLSTYELTRQFQLNQDAATKSTLARFIISYPAGSTVVNEASSPGNTVLKVANTSAFPSVGALILPDEPLPVTYFSKTATSFTGIPTHGCGSLTIAHNTGQSVTTYSSYNSYSSADHKLILQITSCVNQSGKQTEEVRQMVIVPRPGS